VDTRLLRSHFPKAVTTPNHYRKTYFTLLIRRVTTATPQTSSKLPAFVESVIRVAACT